MGNLARRVERLQARKEAKKATDPRALLKNLNSIPQALGALNQFGQQLDDAQTAVVQVLQELDFQDYEQRKQRAISLRMQIDRDLLIAPKPGPDREAHAEAMVAYEEQLRAEYDAVFSLVKLFDWYKNLEKES